MSKHKVSVSKFGVIDRLTQTQVQVAGGFWAIGKALGVAKIQELCTLDYSRERIPQIVN